VNKTYLQDGIYTVTLTVTDQFGAKHTVTSTATVANVAPTVTIVPTTTWKAGVTNSLGFRWTDPAGARDALYTARINWGDGSPIVQFSAATVPPTVITRTKAYAAPGQYTVTITVTDRNGGVGSQTVLITVAP
jgi:PKD repeat protein